MVNFSSLYLQFADMSFDINVLYPTCPTLNKVNSGLDKITSQSITVTAEAGRSS